MILLKSILNLVYPDICCLCGTNLQPLEKYFCITCESNFPHTSFWKHHQNPMHRNLSSRCGVEFAAAFLFFSKGNKVQTLLHLLKYKGEKELGVQLGKMFGAELENQHRIHQWSYLMPVPLHPSKMNTRGYNQSQLLAEGISQILHIPLLNNVLTRTHSSQSQTILHREERWDNVSNVFRILEPEIIKNKHVLLVDDVFTTGATIEACCQATNLANPKKISVVTLAYADY